MTDDTELLRLARRLKVYAQCTEYPPRPQASNPVECNDEPLDPIFWKGAQWAVTEYGLESRRGNYAIHKQRLWEDESTDEGWVIHMSEKRWIDLLDFAEALRIARRIYTPSVPKEVG